jgi:hypothetical protein
MSFDYKKYYMPKDAAGVIGSSDPPRTPYDQAVQRMYGTCQGRETYVDLKELGNRTRADLQMQKEFNPLVKEGYCMSSNSTFPKSWSTDMPKRDCGYASTMDEPSNPYSRSVQFRNI